MQLCKTFFKIAWKKLPAISVYFFVYAAITLLLSFQSQKSIDENFQSKELDICVIDEDQSETSAALTAYLDSMHNLITLENDPEVLQDHLYYRYVQYILTIPEGFEERLISGETDALLSNVKVPGSAAGSFVDAQVDAYLNALELYMAGGYTLPEALEKTADSFADAVPVNNLTFHGDNSTSEQYVFYFYQYLPYIFIVMLICGLGPILITFSQKTLHDRTMCSPIKLTSHSFALSVSCICYSLFIWIIFLLLGLLVYREQMFTPNALYAMLNSLVFLLIAAALTLFISNFTLNSGTLNMISNIVGLGMAFICGVFVPQPMLSDSVLSGARFLPAYWYIRANNMLGGLSTEAFNLNLYWTAIGIQLLFAAAIFAFTLVASKMQRQRH